MRVNSNLVYFTGFLLFSLVLGYALGAPWIDLDGNYYQHMAEHLGGHVFKSNWYPVGMPILIRLFWTLGLSVFWISVVANALRLFLLYLIFKKYLSPVKALLLAFFLNGASWLILGTMLKAESLFVTAILGSIYCFSSSSRRVQIWGSFAFFVLAMLFRHVGLFLGPAYFIALSLVLGFRFPRLLVSFGITLLGVFLANTINSGVPWRPSRESFACMHFVAAANSFDYCKKGLAQDLCRLDPNNKYLNARDLSMEWLNSLQFRPQWPPQILLKSQGGVAVCKMVKEIYTHYIVHEPAVFAKEMLARAWAHFGAWESTELSLYRPRSDTPARMTFFEKTQNALSILSKFRDFYRVLFLMGFSLILFLLFKGLASPALMFSFLSAIGHCLGIISNNPFRVMRYQEVTTLLGSVAIGLAVFTFMQRKLWLKTSRDRQITHS